MPSISAMSADAVSVGSAAHGGRRVQCLGELERGHGVRVVHDAGHVGGEVHDVRQVQDERRLGHVHRRAVRVEGVGDRAHGVLVLLEVLRRVGQRRGQGHVAVVVTGPPDRAGQDAGRDQTALAAHQHLGRGAEHAVDVEGPAGRVVLGQPAQRPPDVDGLLGGGDEVAREHDLLEVAGLDARDGLGDDAHPLARRSARRPRRPAPRGARGASASVTVAAASSAPRETVVSQVRSPRRPTITSGTTRIELPGSSANAKVPKQTSPVPGSSTSSRTTAWEVVSDHHLAASANRVAPVVWISAARPQPTSPSPRRSQVTGWVVGRKSSSDASAGRSSGMVLTTRGRGSAVPSAVVLVVTIGKRTARPIEHVNSRDIVLVHRCPGSHDHSVPSRHRRPAVRLRLHRPPSSSCSSPSPSRAARPSRPGRRPRTAPSSST